MRDLKRDHTRNLSKNKTWTKVETVHFLTFLLHEREYSVRAKAKSSNRLWRRDILVEIGLLRQYLVRAKVDLTCDRRRDIPLEPLRSMPMLIRGNCVI